MKLYLEGMVQSSVTSTNSSVYVSQHTIALMTVMNVLAMPFKLRSLLGGAIGTLVGLVLRASQLPHTSMEAVTSKMGGQGTGEAVSPSLWDDRHCRYSARKHSDIKVPTRPLQCPTSCLAPFNTPSHAPPDWSST